MKSRLTSIAKKIIQIINFHKNHIKVAKGSFISRDTTIGRYTRINAASHLGSCEIGSFCAIGGRLIVRSSDHFINFLNMQDYFQTNILQSSVKVAGKTKGKTKIGHGVWIGDSVIILSGVNIGNGAVIGAGSVVTKSIPAYAIAVGNPAKVIKYRFDNAICTQLEELQWWSWDINKIRQNKFIFEIDLQRTTADELKTILTQKT